MPKKRRIGLPITIRYGLPLAIVVWLLWLGIGAWEAGRVTLNLRGAGGEPVTAAKLELFRYDDRPWAASPPERYGERQLDGSSRMEFDAETMPAEALVRIHSADHGVAFAFLELGGGSEVVDLAPPAPIEGRLLGPEDQPLDGARIQAFGGGSRGVLLAETETDAEGRFRIDEISAAVSLVTLRSAKPGWSRSELDWTRAWADELVLRSRPTEPCRGRLVSERLDELAGLEVRLLSLPGLSSTVRPDGSFVFDQVPPHYREVFAAIPELPEGLTFRHAPMRPGGPELRIELVAGEVLRGQVLNAYTDLPVTGAEVWHPNGPLGIVSATTDSSGRFEIGLVPPGSVIISANQLVPRKMLPKAARERGQPSRVLLQGTTQVVVISGAERPDLVLRIE